MAAGHHLLTVGVDLRVRAAADAWSGASKVDHETSVQSAISRFEDSIKPDVILLQASSSSTPSDGAALVTAARGAQLVALLPPDQLLRFRARLPFIPTLGRAWTAADDVPADELHRLLEAASAFANERKAHSDTIARINTQLGTKAQHRANPPEQPGLTERYFVTLLSTAPDAFFALDGAGSVVALNDAAASLFDADRSETALSIQQIVADGAGDDVTALLRRLACGEIVRQLELPLRVDEGAPPRWIEVSLAPVVDVHGRLESLSGTAREITDRKIADANLASLNLTLEQRVETAIAERELAQAALKQSQKMEAMGQLTGGVAHDFNNLLTPIIGSLDLIQRKGKHSEREARLIDGALQSAERAKTLVQRLLAFARRQPLQVGPIDAARLLTNMAGLIASTSGPQIKVDTRIVEPLPAAVADANQLEMAILNLAVNARDAMPYGGTLTITARAAAAPDELPLAGDLAVCISVVDTGTGMDAETLSRAIEPFFSTKGIGQGTGLGLSMVHGLAQQLGGGMVISSQPMIGTQVDLWLPVSVVTLEPAALPTTERLEEYFSGRALVVDDEPAVRLTTSGMLESLGFETSEADDAMAAEQLLREGETFELVVTDHLMPGRTGAEFALTVRQHWPNTKVLIITGYADAEGIAPELSRLTKPFREAELANAIRNLTAAGSR